MDLKRLMILLVAGVMMAFGAIAMRGWLSQKAAEPEVKVSNRVVIATRDLTPGNFVQSGKDISWLEVQPDTIKDIHLREGNVQIENFNGAVVRLPIRSGEPLTTSSLTRTAEGGFMSAVLEPGMRAVSIGVDATSGNAGFISPGDRVDLIVTHRLRNAETNSAQDGSVVSETFVRDVRVIAVDQMLDNPENKAILAKTVTVQVNPRQAEQIAVAGEMGKISMTLRSQTPLDKGASTPQSDAMSELYGVTRESDVSQSANRGGSGIAATIRVIRGNEVENLQFR